MKYYINTNNQIFAFDDEQVALGLANGLTPITEEQLAELLAPTPEQLLEQAKAEAIAVLNDTGWIIEKYTDLVVIQQAMTNDEFNAKYADVLAKRNEARELL